MTGSIANSENGRLLTKRKTHAEVVGATESIQLYSSTEADEIKSLELLKLGKIGAWCLQNIIIRADMLHA